MDADDTLYGRIKNGILTISGNRPSIRVDGGCLVVSDGPVPIPSNHRGPALSAEDRMVTSRFRRADCALKRIVVTRPDGFITFGAIKWLHDVGISLVQLDWDGTVLLATAPAGNDVPALRRAQALAAASDIGLAITRELLRVKVSGQAEVAGLLGSAETAELIAGFGNELGGAADLDRILALEVMAASAYWPLWQPITLGFARRDRVPEHWQTFGGRHSPLSGKPLKAATAGNAILNYLYGIAIGEMTIALTAAGLDPGLGLFHTDRDRRASLACDAIEAIRPYVDGWLARWLATARFSKRDLYEEPDGAVRITRPLTSHLAMTAAIWRPAAQAIAGWLARAFASNVDRSERLASPFPSLPAPRRTWQGLEPPIPKICHECGKGLAPKQQKFCSEACSVSFHLAVTIPAQVAPLPLPRQTAGAPIEVDPGGSEKNRRNLALRRAWDAAQLGAGGNPQSAKANGRHIWAMPTDEKRREWFSTVLAPRLADIDWAEIQRATGVSKRYAFMLKAGYVPHPRHYPALGELVGVTAPPAPR